MDKSNNRQSKIFSLINVKKINKNFGVAMAFDVVAIVCCFSLVLRLFVYLVDIKVINTIKKNKELIKVIIIELIY